MDFGANSNINAETVLSIDNLKVHFPFDRSLMDIIQKKPANVVRAVDGISLRIKRNEVLGLVGETGCGKSTFVKTILGINTPTDGTISFEGTDTTKLSKKQRREFFSKVQMVWQDPYSCLNPAMKIRDIIATPAVNFDNLSWAEGYKKVEDIIKIVGLSENEMDRYPHEFSGGGRQRIVIARALISNPTFLIADEPTASLDVSIQAQILNLLAELRAKYNLTMLLISHDLAIINFASDRVAVMYFGRIVELMPKKDILTKNYHWYTKKLFDAIPTGKRRIDTSIEEEKSNKLNYTGCIYYHQCSNAKEKCLSSVPVLENRGEAHFVACHYPREPEKEINVAE